MKLFWRFGYDGVSLTQIHETLGISKPSLYNSFGNKEQLFRAALDRYDQTADAMRLAFLDDTQSPAQAIRALLRTTAEKFSAPEPGIGCMILTGTIASHPDNAGLVAELMHRRENFHSRLACKFRRWIGLDEARSLARCLMASMQGMALQAHDGASHDMLVQFADDMAAAFLARLDATAPHTGSDPAEPALCA